MFTYVYVRFVIGFLLLCTLGTPQANYYSAAFPERVWQCRNAAMPWSGKNTGPKPRESDLKKMRFQRADVDVA